MTIDLQSRLDMIQLSGRLLLQFGVLLSWKALYVYIINIYFIYSCLTVDSTSSENNVLVCGRSGRTDCEIYNPMTDEWSDGTTAPSSDYGQIINFVTQSAYYQSSYHYVFMQYN